MKLLRYFLLSIFVMQYTFSSACIGTERTALLAFRSKLEDPGNVLSTWKGQNCCSWKGVTCHNQSGHVLKLNLRNSYIYPWGSVIFYYGLYGEMDPSLVSLRNLTHLDLSGNSFYGTRIPNFIGQFENLVYLNLSWTQYVGEIPTEMGNLKRLRFLDMSNTFVDGPIPPQLGNISTLSFLSFAQNACSFCVPFKIGNIEWISKLNSLQYLDLSYHNLSSSKYWFPTINKLNNLKVLNLQSCSLQNIPITIDSINLTSLTTLDLSYNSFDSLVPSWLSKLASISHLDLSYAGFHGFSIGFWSNPKERLCHLRYLDLSQVNITEDITDFVTKFGCSWEIIEVFYLANNYLYGSLPKEIVKFSKLSHLDLSVNQLEGIISQKLLDGLTQLKVLDLSNNMLKLAIDHPWLPKFQLTELALQSCDVGPSFPLWLKSQKQMKYLNLKNSSISDVLPTWFWRPSYVGIDLSYNNLRGNLPHNLHVPNLLFLILRSNNLGGPIKSLPTSLEVLDISNNLFTGTLQWVSNQSLAMYFSVKSNFFIGEIPSSVCEMVHPMLIDLSSNKLSGIIPSCVSKLKILTILDMSFNNLSGTIPNSIGSLVDLYSLALHGNILTGELPTNLQNCQRLNFLDLGNNKLTGKVPKWIGVRLQNLVYLQLKENNFNGKIPTELALLPKLHVIDISNNNLEGSIPDSFGNFSAMSSSMSKTTDVINFIFRTGPSDPHLTSKTITCPYTLLVTTKGETMEYSKNLYLVNYIDLSSNNLSGPIPDGIVTLKALETLNLSRNNLNGKIPEKIGNINSLESLDLSFNKLSGEIPQSISELTFLSYLNLSYNNLSGPIPDGNQLNTLNDSSIYIGNAFLCGGPMNRSCLVGSAQHNISDKKTSSSYNPGLYVSIGVGFVVGWWVVWCIHLAPGTWLAVFVKKIDCFKLIK